MKRPDPFEVLPLCMGDICSTLIKHFSNEYYKWEEVKGVKTFECLVLSKFLIDHALLTTFNGKIAEERIKSYLYMIDAIFKALFENTFQKSNLTFDSLKDVINNKLTTYGEILAENPHPRCWQLIAGACTGIDYYAQKDVFTLTGSSIMLPELLMYAQDTLESVIKR